jgi:hypothetical protein
MPLSCARCGTGNPDVARYCRNCGLPLRNPDGAAPVAGRAPHPQPLPAPPEYQPVTAATDLYFRSEAAGGGQPLLGTETLVLRVFNGGHDLAHVVLHVSGLDPAGSTLFGLHRELEELPRGRTVPVEIPSWELPEPISNLTTKLVSAEFVWTSGSRSCS